MYTFRKSLVSPQARFKLNSQYSDYLSSFFVGTNCYDQQRIDSLEHDIKDMLNTQFAICTSQARVGIYLAIKALIPEGREVILSPNTIADVINMVICAGAKPVFCDIDPLTGNIDHRLIKDLITPQTAGILVTHLYGLVTSMEEICNIAKTYKLWVIEDAAQAFGALKNDQYAGTIGDIGVYSFGMAKNVMAFFGGMVVTKHAEVEERIRRMIKDYPVIASTKFRKKVFSCFIKEIATIDFIFANLMFPLFRIGYRKKVARITKLIEAELDLSRKHVLPDAYKENMSSAQAAIILKKLSMVDTDFQHRFKCAVIYYEGLKDITELLLPPMMDDGSHVYNYYPIGFSDRLKLRSFLMNNSRDIALQHIKNTADLPAFKDFYRDCPNCRKWAQRTIMMPNYPKYKLSEVEKNVQVIRNFFGV